MAFDDRQEHKACYLPSKTPGVVIVPAINFLAVGANAIPRAQ